MTMADERARALRFAGEVLGEMLTRPDVPEDLKHQARMTLRHYPPAAEIDRHARVEARRAQRDADPLEPAWLEPERWG